MEEAMVVWMALLRSRRLAESLFGPPTPIVIRSEENPWVELTTKNSSEATVYSMLALESYEDDLLGALVAGTWE